ncbi:putative GTP-binding protein [Trypanosoma vivax]|nr:putative GTP-binding protein [Trypanosoma vivax]
MHSLGKSLQRSKQKLQRSSRDKYRQLLEAEQNAAMVRELEERQQQGRKGAPLKSIWETSNLEEFLLIAEAQERGYEAARDLHLVVDGTPHVVTDDRVLPLSDDKVDWIKMSELLTIPRRPHWNYEMSAQELHSLETSSFFEWRRRLSRVEEEHKVIMTPYEKNLEVWRQLWRVTERADIVMLILDARNPLVFRCADFEASVRETRNKAGKPKKVIFLLNKSDLLTEKQRRVWADYFIKREEPFVFFSATPRSIMGEETLQKEGDMVDSGQNSDHSCADSDTGNFELGADNDSEENVKDNDRVISKLMRNKKEKRRHNKKSLRAPVVVANPYQLVEQRRVEKERRIQQKCERGPKKPQPSTADEKARDARTAQLKSRDPWSVLAPEELLDHLALWRTACGITDSETPLMVGLVGYPNVGKSSTINAIIGCKKVVVSATPGKTKHFQTLSIPNERRIALCDCPGLVFPSFASTRAQMVCDGILPIDTATDVEAAVAVLCQRIPRQVLELQFNVSLSAQDDRDDSHSPAERLLNAVARRRGYLAAHDRPNRSRAARDVLKLYVDGALVYVEPPPSYHPTPTAAHGSKSLGLPGSQEKEYISISSGDTDDNEEEWEDVNSLSSDVEDYDEEAWNELDRAAAARALSDDGSVRGGRASDEGDVGEEPQPMFYARPNGLRGELSRQEALNAEANVQRILAAMAAREVARGRRRTNHQLEPADEIFVNEDGEVELLVDDDDGIIQISRGIDRCGTSGAGELAKETGKKMSKRQMRRELKRSGAGPVNPTARKLAVQGYY